MLTSERSTVSEVSAVIIAIFSEGEGIDGRSGASLRLAKCAFAIEIEIMKGKITSEHLL